MASRTWAAMVSWSRPLRRWTQSYPLLAFNALLLLGFAWRIVAAPFGIPDLFWHEEVRRQLAAGFGAGILLLDLGAAGCLLDGSRFLRWPTPPPISLQSAAETLFARYLAVTVGPLWLALSLGFITVPEGAPRWPLPLAALATVVGGVALVIMRGRQMGEAVKERTPAGVARNIETKIEEQDLKPLHFLAFSYFIIRLVLFAVLWLLWAFLEEAVPVALVITLILGLATSGYGYIRSHYPERSFGAIALIAFVIVVGNAVIGGHRLLDLDNGRLRSVTETQVVSLADAGLLARDTALGGWLQGRRSYAPWGQSARKPPLVVLAVDGGGIRAAVWTIAVLTQLESDVPDLPYHVRVVTGASGGMVGAGFYIASLQPPGAGVRHRDGLGAPLDRRQMIERSGADSLAPLARALLFHDMPLVPMLFSPDRGETLQRTWEDQTKTLGVPFVSLREGEAAGWRPSLIISPVIVEDGRRLLFSNLDLKELGSISIPSTPPVSSLEDIEFFRMFSEGKNLRLSTALRLNATFPYATSAAELPTKPARRVMDSGYYDEHGVDLATSWIWMEREWLQANTSGVLLIQVPDSRAEQARVAPVATRRKWWARGVAEFTGPLEALLSTRDASMAFRNDRIARVLADSFQQSGSELRTIVFEPEVFDAPKSLLDKLSQETTGDPPQQDVALGWRLTSRELRHLSGAICRGRNLEQRRELQNWWTAHGGVAPAEPAACASVGHP